MRDRVSVVTTVLNEAASIDILLHSLAQQTRVPDEVVVVDGGSADETLQKLESYAQNAPFSLQVLSRPGHNISQGRNVAIAAAQHALIAATDAGVRLEKDWLEQLLAPLSGEDSADVVSGAFVAAPETVFEVALGAVTLPTIGEIDAATFNPSSRSVAFRREAWQRVGGYPEWLDYCEDLLFDLSLRDAGYRFAFAPRAVAHFRPRPTLAAFYKQYYRYARGDGKADLWRYRHLVRYGTYLVALPALVALSIVHSPLWLLALAIGMAMMLRKPLWRLQSQWGHLPWRKRLSVLGWLPIIRITGDVAKMLGYPAGIWWRRRYAPAGTWPKPKF